MLNGAVGDRLLAAENTTAIAMELRLRDPDTASLDVVDLDTLPQGDAPPRATLLVHGLMGSEHAWALGTADAPGADPQTVDRRELGTVVAQQRGGHVLYLRYNSGRHISDNGRELAEQLERLHDAWPGTLERLDVVAHSMGGLVMRSALHYGLEAGHAWPRAAGTIVLLGTPSHGAPLEQLAHVAAFTLESIWNPWTKLIGKAINLRSAGIKDLRHGFCTEEDWRHKDQDTLRLQRPRPTRSPDHVRWYVAAGSTGTPEHWVSKLVGDGLVRPPSARGLGYGTEAPGALPGAEVRVFGNINHMGLMNDPAVVEQVLDWLQHGDAPGLPRPAGSHDAASTNEASTDDD